MRRRLVKIQYCKSNGRTKERRSDLRLEYPKISGAKVPSIVAIPYSIELPIQHVEILRQ